jgi:fatty-acyl-CoA synthase
MQESEAEALIVLGPMQENKAGSEIWEKTLAIVDEVTSLKLILQVNLTPPEVTEFKSPGGIPVHDFDTYIRQFNGDNLDFDREILPDGVAAYFHTGGTTGRPKLAQHSHLNHVHLSSMMIDMLNFDEHSVAFGGLPLFHVNSFFNSGLNMFRLWRSCRFTDGCRISG